MYAVFTYGSLMFESVWKRVVQGDYPSSHASLDGYRRLSVINETYPALVPVPGTHSIQGVVYQGVSHDDIGRLDEFEGDYYRREEVEVIIAGGQRMISYTYVFRPEYQQLLSTRDWNPDTFRRNGLDAFLQRYLGFQRIGS